MPHIVSRIVDVCIFRFSGDQPEFLLLQRAPDDGLYPHLWQFVSGTIEEGEQAKEAALRELREETMVQPLTMWVAPHVNMFYDPARDTIHCNPLFVVRVAPTAEPRLSAEHVAFRWLPFPEATKTLVWPEHRTALSTIYGFIVSGEDAARYSIIEPE